MKAYVHQITEYRKIPGHNMKDRYGCHIITDTDFDPETASIKFVTFKGLIQQVCKDFGIGYIWYDQMCIDQNNPEEKMREIKQMHRIYKNALCTVALVPELQFTIEDDTLTRANGDILPSTQWCKRIWTLEEAYNSRYMLFLGHNVHIWGDSSFIWMILQPNTRPVLKPAKWKACTALWCARNRTTSKAHDRVFALANIFPELMDGITFSYDQPLYDLMLKFYSALAQKDPSILCCGAPVDSDSEDGTTTVRQEEERVSRPRKYIRTLTDSGRAVIIAAPQSKGLPSWTGANGVHIPQFALNYGTITTPFIYTVSGDCMRLESPSVTVRIESAKWVEIPDDFDNPARYRDVLRIKTDWTCKEYKTKDTRMYYFTEEGLPAAAGIWELCIAPNDNGPTDYTFVTTPNRLDHLSRDYSVLGLKITHFISVVVENEPDSEMVQLKGCGGYLSLTEECSECIILEHSRFQLDNTGPPKFAYPVIRKVKGYYRSIGIYIMPSSVCFNMHLRYSISPFDIR